MGSCSLRETLVKQHMVDISMHALQGVRIYIKVKRACVESTEECLLIVGIYDQVLCINSRGKLAIQECYVSNANTSLLIRPPARWPTRGGAVFTDDSPNTKKIPHS